MQNICYFATMFATILYSSLIFRVRVQSGHISIQICSLDYDAYLLWDTEVSIFSWVIANSCQSTTIKFQSVPVHKNTFLCSLFYPESSNIGY
jgi:hypothetical protein